MAEEVSDPSEYPIYATTFTVHRLSPLFTGSTVLDSPALYQYASAFRDLLAGEVLRGVRVGLGSDDDVIARVGGLQTVRWSILRSEEDWQNQTQETGDDTNAHEQSRRGTLVEITYERGSYSAILLHDSKAQEKAGFSNYPLLLTRMPGALRETFLDFLATTFDTRASILKLSSSLLTSVLEKYVEDITTSESGPLDVVRADKALRSVTKDILITLAFHIPGSALALKTVDVTIPRDDLFSMVIQGRKLQQAGRSGNSSGPITIALRHYLDAHLALNIDDSHVTVSRIACGAFIIGTEGKIKLLAPPNGADEETAHAKATNALVLRLIEVARGSKLSPDT